MLNSETNSIRPEFLAVTPSGQARTAFLLAVLVYIGMLFNGFTFDDYMIIVRNPHLNQKDFLSTFFSGRYFAVSGEASYRPVTTLATYIGFKLSGVSPVGFHVISILLHGLTCFFLTLLAARWVSGRWPLWIGCAMAVHPILTEAVCGITFNDDLLVAFFFILSLFLVETSTKHDSIRRRLLLYIAAGISFAISVFAKESGLVLPLLIVAAGLLSTDLQDRRKRIWSSLWFLVPVAIGFVLVRFWLLPGQGSGSQRLGGDLISSVLTSSNILAHYAERMIFPLNLSMDRTPVIISSVLDWRFLLSIIIHLALLISAFLLRKKDPGLTFGILWFYAALAPVSNLIPIYNPETDRYLYLPAAGFLLALGAIGSRLTQSQARYPKIMAPVFCIFLAVWTAQTFRRIPDWYSNETLWAHELQLRPGNSRAMTEIAIEKNRKGKYMEAERLSLQAIMTDPDNSLAWLQLAKSNLMRGKYDEAMTAYTHVLQKNDIHVHHLSQAWFDTAYILEKHLNDPGKAIEHYQNALLLEPSFLGASFNLGALHANQGDWRAALEVWEKALSIYPDNTDLRDNIALARRKLAQ